MYTYAMGTVSYDEYFCNDIVHVSRLQMEDVYDGTEPHSFPI